jgi:hypothetical protein
MIALFGSRNLLELLYLGYYHRLRRMVSTTSVQDLNTGTPAIFRMQIEQILKHLEQPKKIRLETKREL